MSLDLTKGFLDFADKNPSIFHVTRAIERMIEQDVKPLKEGQSWNLEPGRIYTVSRNNSSTIIFRMPKNGDFSGFHICASHSDSPGLKIKGLGAEMREGAYIKLNVETYGGLLMAPWFDRPLSLAGRVMVKEDGRIFEELVNIDRDLLMIPSVAIHMNRDANKGIEYNPQIDLLPLLGLTDDLPNQEKKRGRPKKKDEAEQKALLKIIAETVGTEPENLVSCDLFVYDRTLGRVWGANEEFFSSKHIDDLQCAYVSARALMDAKPAAPKAGGPEAIPVVAIFDNEEVGSLSKQGADSTFLTDTLMRICEACGMRESDYRRALANSFMISADNAHALHPNHPELHDPQNRPIMNGGIVLKHAANQKYTTDAVSAALFKELCSEAGVPYQEFYNRSDKVGGGTLGNISNAHVSLNTVDIGLPQLAMHSPYETAGVKDSEYLYKVLKLFFEKSLRTDGGYRFE